MATDDARLNARLDAVEAQQAAILAAQAADRDERREIDERIAYLYVVMAEACQIAGIPVGQPAVQQPPKAGHLRAVGPCAEAS